MKTVVSSGWINGLIKLPLMYGEHRTEVLTKNTYKTQKNKSRKETGKRDKKYITMVEMNFKDYGTI